MAFKVLIAAGGTGGHLFPAQQLTEMLLKEGGCEICFAGHKLEESPFFQKEKIPFEEISSASPRKIFLFLKKASLGFFQAIRLLRHFQPDIVVGFGSFHSFPVLLAAVFLRKKMVLFEANCILGKVNRLFLPFSEKIALQFPLLSKRSVFVPLLPWTERRQCKMKKEEALASYGLDPKKKTLLVFGGSQGAAFLNEEFPKVALLLKERGADFQVLHLAGKGKTAKYETAAYVKEFEEEMEKAYTAADWVLCRSGAGTCAELIRFAKPALLIPYPFAAEDHQKVNGEFLSQKIRGARMLLQKEATSIRLAEEMEALWREAVAYRDALQSALKRETVDFASLVRMIGKRK